MQECKEGKRANLWGPARPLWRNMLMEIGPEYWCLKQLGHNSNVYKRLHQHLNVSKNKIGIPMFIKIAPEFQ